jgi:cytochrome c-type biogenesis protein CcmF
MIPEYGLFALIMTFVTAIALAVVPMWGSWRGHSATMSSARPLAIVMFAFCLLSFLCLTYLFLTDDFSVVVVASNSNSLLPDFYKFSAVWGNHEGSMLLWVLVLAGWTLAVAIFSADLPKILLARVLSIMGIISVGFVGFSLLTSNPFARHLPSAPMDGSDLNPLLQDPGLIIHPPLLYMGYVGFSVAFAFAIAALMGGRLDAAWARWSRPWTNVAWGFLTLGIMLGSWWAYYELGWGGWWFWDPVENASFMPWLAGTALVHSLAVTEKRGVFKSWTVLLAIATFSLSLLGAFLVRSGVLTSVHAFATDPERGLYILVFLLIVVGGSLLLFALRAPAVNSEIRYSWLSRETLLLFNNVVFLVATLTILFGTLFPLLMDALGQGKYSVGPPYFNAVFIPLMALLVPAMGIGPFTRWRADSGARWTRPLMYSAVVSLLMALILPLLDGAMNVWVSLAVLLAVWIVLGLVTDIVIKRGNSGTWLSVLRRQTPSYWGMVIAHLGFAMTIISVVVVTQWNMEKDLRMVPGDTVTFGDYQFQFEGVEKVRGSNYDADEATFSAFYQSRLIAELKPQKRRYFASGQIMTEAAIDAGFTRDLYVALGEPLGADDAWSVRLHYKPLVRWMWIGATLIGFGAFITAFDKRYRRTRSVKELAPGVSHA